MYMFHVLEHHVLKHMCSMCLSTWTIRENTIFVEYSSFFSAQILLFPDWFVTYIVNKLNLVSIGIVVVNMLWSKPMKAVLFTFSWFTFTNDLPHTSLVRVLHIYLWEHQIHVSTCAFSFGAFYISHSTSPRITSSWWYNLCYRNAAQHMPSGGKCICKIIFDEHSGSLIIPASLVQCLPAVPPTVIPRITSQEITDETHSSAISFAMDINASLPISFHRHWLPCSRGFSPLAVIIRVDMRSPGDSNARHKSLPNCFSMSCIDVGGSYYCNINFLPDKTIISCSW